MSSCIWKRNRLYNVIAVVVIVDTSTSWIAELWLFPLSLLTFSINGQRPVVYYILAALVLFSLYTAGKLVYNLLFHPLCGFPGPKIAAMTSLYEFWYDVINDGQYLWQIEKMHEKYGPPSGRRIGDYLCWNRNFIQSDQCRFLPFAEQ